MPRETVAGLVPPLAGFPYFAGAEEAPFQPRAEAYCAVNAWWLADASFLVYGDAPFVEAEFEASPLPALGFTLGWLGTPEVNRGLILENDDLLVIAFRGTRMLAHSLLDVLDVAVLNQDDLWVDSLFLPAAHQAGGRVHGGFLKAFREISGRLDEANAGRRPGQALWLTGHSLGGALAVLAAAHLEPAAVSGLYTFGCPRVGDAAFCRALPGRSHHRFVHRGDIVPGLPPEFLGYAHAGTLHALGDGPCRGMMEDLARASRELAQALRWPGGEAGSRAAELPFLSGVADHMPVYYATLLWNALIGA